MITREPLTGAYFPDSSRVAAAEQTIAELEHSIAPPAWSFLDKATIVNELRARVRDPFQINQGGQPFCGPACAIFELIRRDPVHYVELCRSLFLIGGFQGRSHYIAASDRLRSGSHGDLKMAQVDWMVLATLREMENILFPVEPNAPDVIRNLAGMTKSWEMKGWVSEILGYSQVNYDHAYLLNDMVALANAATVLQKGGVALALITAEGMLQDQRLPVPYPSHWVAIVGGIEIQNNSVQFDIYTWSKALRVQMDTSAFRQYFWGTVTGLP